MRARGLIVAVLLVAVVGAACGSTEDASSTSSTLATATSVGPVARPAEAAEPGTVIETTEIQPPAGGRSWRVDYHSTDVAGAPTAQRMTLTIPMTTPPADGFPVVLYGHPTKGTADVCAPSLEGPTAIPLIAELLGAGFAVVAPDYEGLAAEGPHPYLVGTSEARSLLDAARAATEVKGAGVAATSPMILWGFSQGGHAALFAAQLAPELAPELDLRGVAVAAPVSDVAHFVRRAEDWPAQFGILVTVVGSYALAYPELDATTVLTPAVVDELGVLEERCITEVTAHFDRDVASMLTASPLDQDDWSARFAENLTGTVPLGLPALVVQGAQDEIIDPADTQALVDRLCANGVPTSFLLRPGENHAVHTDDVLLPWLQGRIADGAPPDNCP